MKTLYDVAMKHNTIIKTVEKSISNDPFNNNKAIETIEMAGTSQDIAKCINDLGALHKDSKKIFTVTLSY